MTTALKPISVDVSPEMDLYKILQRQSYGVETALAEFVDNSIQAYIDKKTAIQKSDGPETRLDIKISIDTTKHVIKISDNACGISRKNFQNAIKIGNKSRKSAGSLGFYGIGMKSAAIWFSNSWELETSCLGAKEKIILSFDLDDLLSRGKTKINATATPEKSKNHYTIVKLSNFIRTITIEDCKEVIVPYLLETFLKFKNDVSIELRFNDEVITPKTKKVELNQPEILKYPPVDRNGVAISKKEIVWKKKVDFQYKTRKVKGFVLIRKVGSYTQPGIRLLRNRRVIVGTTVNRNITEKLFGTKNKYSAQRIYGELHLDGFPVNFMKTGFDENLDAMYEKLVDNLFIDGHSMTHQATHYRARGSKKPDPTNASATTATTATSEINETASTSTGSRNTGNTKIKLSNDIHSRLKQLNASKLINLYESLCTVSLTEHSCLMYVGAWSFLESIASFMSKGYSDSFDAFFNSKMNLWYTHKNDKSKKSDFRTCLKDISDKGNANKHSGRKYNIDAKQLYNDFEVLEIFLIRCLDEVIKTRTP